MITDAIVQCIDGNNEIKMMIWEINLKIAIDRLKYQLRQLSVETATLRVCHGAGTGVARATSRRFKACSDIRGSGRVVDHEWN